MGFHSEVDSGLQQEEQGGPRVVQTDVTVRHTGDAEKKKQTNIPRLL